MGFIWRLLLINEGCDFIQGYIYGRPMTSKKFEKNVLRGMKSNDTKRYSKLN